jgi:hypothetical protein
MDNPVPHLRIGELARLSGRSVHTIRWYEAQSLMPGAARDAGGRRVFSQAHVDWLELMEGGAVRQVDPQAWRGPRLRALTSPGAPTPQSPGRFAPRRYRPPARNPPSTAIAWPVTNAAAGEAR